MTTTPPSDPSANQFPPVAGQRDHGPNDGSALKLFSVRPIKWRIDDGPHCVTRDLDNGRQLTSEEQTLVLNASQERITTLVKKAESNPLSANDQQELAAWVTLVAFVSRDETPSWMPGDLRESFPGQLEPWPWDRSDPTTDLATTEVNPCNPQVPAFN